MPRVRSALLKCERGCGFWNFDITVVEDHEKTCQHEEAPEENETVPEENVAVVEDTATNTGV